MKTICTSCGHDCSHAYATWHGDPYHFGCMPLPKNKPRPTDDRKAVDAQTELRKQGELK